MPIIFNEEKIIVWFKRINSFEKDIYINKVLTLLSFSEDTIKLHNCQGVCIFLGHIVINIWTDLILHLENHHPDILQKVQTTNLLEDASTHIASLKSCRKGDPWLLHFTTKHVTLSNCLQKICLALLELSNELLFSPIMEDPWIEKIVREGKDIRKAISTILADINIHNLGNFAEF